MNGITRRKIALMSLIALLLFSGLAALTRSASAQGGEPLISDKYVNDTSVITGDPCGPPCFNNITPGTTTFTDAVAIIKADPRFSNAQTQDNPSQAVWATAAGQSCCQMTGDTKGIVASLLIRVAPNVTVKQLIDKYGEPTYTTTTESSTSEVAIALIYPKLGFVTWAAPGDASSALKPETPLVLNLYLAPDQIDNLLKTATLQGWPGYQPYATFKAATPVITPLPPPTMAALPTVAASAEDLKSPCYALTPPEAKPIDNPPRQFSAPEQVIDPTHTYCAFITTEHGTIVIELFPQYAPKHVNSFAFLANKGFYDGLTWHRVISDFMAQGGDPEGTGGGGPGYSIPLETNPAVKYDQPGMLGMARTNDPNSAGSQFFITFGPQPSLDPQSGSDGYTIFGRVVKGMDVVQQIRARDPGQANVPGDKLLTVRVVDATTGK